MVNEMGILKFLQAVFTIIFFIAGFIGISLIGYQLIGNVTNQYSRTEQIFIFLSNLGLIIFPVLFLGNITNQHKNIETIAKFGLIASIAASFGTMAIIGNNFWGKFCCPSGFNGSFYMFVLILLTLFFINSIILVLIHASKK